MNGPALDLLAGDVGGTNTRLVRYRLDEEGRLERGAQVTYESQGAGSLAALLERFRREHGGFDHACLGLPGPVRAGRCAVTNLPWALIDAAELQAELGLASMTLLNDLEAHAHGLPLLGPDQLATLRPGAPDAAGNQALIAAGTGLGEAGLTWDGAGHRPFATEGGHVSFAPGSELELELLRFLAARHGHVSWERLVSGPGLATLFEFLVQHRRAPLPSWFRELPEEARPAAVTAAAEVGEDALADEAVGWFVRLYGAEAGNLALKLMATGGVFVAGAIAVGLLPRFARDGFLAAFHAKGRMEAVLRTMPVHVVLEPGVGLLGAARVAAEAARR